MRSIFSWCHHHTGLLHHHTWLLLLHHHTWLLLLHHHTWLLLHHHLLLLLHQHWMLIHHDRLTHHHWSRCHHHCRLTHHNWLRCHHHLRLLRILRRLLSFIVRCILDHQHLKCQLSSSTNVTEDDNKDNDESSNGTYNSTDNSTGADSWIRIVWVIVVRTVIIISVVIAWVTSRAVGIGLYEGVIGAVRSGCIRTICGKRTIVSRICDAVLSCLKSSYLTTSDSRRLIF